MTVVFPGFPVIEEEVHHASDTMMDKKGGTARLSSLIRESLFLLEKERVYAGY